MTAIAFDELSSTVFDALTSALFAPMVSTLSYGQLAITYYVQSQQVATGDDEE